MFVGKAGSLAALSAIPGINVPEFVVLHPGLSKQDCLVEVQSFINALPRESYLAVRSSAPQEDTLDASFAGIYKSKLNVPASVPKVYEAIIEVQMSGLRKKQVVAHYTSRRNVVLAEAGMSVILQRMITSPDVAGVIFSHSLAEHDGYYSISITSGLGESIVDGSLNGQLIRIVRNVELNAIQETWLRDLIIVMRVVEKHFHSMSLDVEFAVKGGVLYLLQCRPITTVCSLASAEYDRQLLDRVSRLNNCLVDEFSGDVLGDMIDINPLELLGARPSALDVSIFRHLFADRIVEQVREEMGYEPLHTGLLRVVAWGKPYASMRATAFSFRPRGIPNGIYDRIVNVYREDLISDPSLQSRVEFDLYAMSMGDKLECVMARACLNESEKKLVREAFVQLDASIATISEDYQQRFAESARAYDENTNLLHGASPDAILEHVATGTKLFVLVARLAFYWKNRLEEKYPEQDFNSLLAGHIQTIHGSLQDDLISCRDGILDPMELVKRYGHLRPGQFGVFSEAYADDPEVYLFSKIQTAQPPSVNKNKHAFEDVQEFRHAVTFMQAREQMKFLFARPFHLFVTTLKHAVANRGITPCTASQFSWDALRNYLFDQSAPAIEDEAVCREYFPLPEVIIPGITDLRIIISQTARPSYITRELIKAHVHPVQSSGVKADIKGAIVLLPTADPGYDFIFHSGVAGVITKVGGPASHMCIRAIELQVPACIGCGEAIYESLLSAKSVILDCNVGQIIKLD